MTVLNRRPAAFMLLLSTLLSFIQFSGASSNLIRALGPQGVNLWKLNNANAVKTSPVDFTVQSPDSYEPETTTAFRAQWFRQPLDHFDKSNKRTFRQRYWVNARHYQPGVGGPVIVIDGGETSGADRLPFLDTGIAEILAKATGGVGVVLEHRYYGRSIPVQNFTTDNLRWLNNAQSAADSANFMANVKFAGIDEDLTAPGTPWIYYGGSYAGARAAHMRILYPELVYGAIASSAVTHAALTNWEYMDVIRKAAEPKCSKHLTGSIATIDNILTSGRFAKPLKALFGLSGLTHDDDFASVLTTPLGSWQAKCWDPQYGSNAFEEFCQELTKLPLGHGAGVLSAEFGHSSRMVEIEEGLTLDFAILNYASYIKKHVITRCPEEKSQEECFGTYDASQYKDVGIDQDWRLWMFQVCTEWGYFTTAPPDPNMPRIISKLITLPYEAKLCHQAFPPGQFMSVPQLPNVTAVNVLGDFDIAADRLAFIDGDVDPWRPDTPHSDYAYEREDTLLRPFKIIPGGVHHYDEYGLRNIADEPAEIRKIHGEMIVFVMEWLKDWKKPETVT